MDLPFCRPGWTDRVRQRLVPARAGRSKPLLLVLLLVGPGPAVADDASAAGRRVFSYFYYWYEPRRTDDPRIVESHELLGLHFPAEKPGDWRSAAWFKQQLRDMQQAGVDVALAVYWGDGLYESTTWSTAGLGPLVQALDELDAAGEAHPRLGLFFDTYVLQGAPLAEPDRRSWFAEQLLGFFRRVPERHRATQDGRPIVWLYYSDFANSFDQQTFDRLGDALEAELGARPFWVAEASWRWTTWTDLNGQRHFDRARPIQFDALYRWGGAFRDTLFVKQPWPLASVGPGYDDTRIHSRGDRRFDRQRESGCFYARNWRRAQLHDARWVVIETWNELYEGSAVAETREWKREYLDATAAYSAAFKQGRPIPLPRWCREPTLEGDDPALAQDEPTPTPPSGARIEAGTESLDSIQDVLETAEQEADTLTR